MKKKDPAFLFYPQRWLEGTAEFSSAEKGVYIDLLAHQHQKGSIPADTKRLCRLTGLSEAEFLPIWEGLKSKFGNHSVDRLVNRTLNEISTERSTKSITNSITGKLASLIRSVSHLPKEQIEFIKEGFETADFIGMDKETVNRSVTEWFNVRLESIININRNKEGIKEGVGGKKEEGKNGFKSMPLYTDFNGLPEIKIGAAIQLLKITKQTTVTETQVSGLWEVFKIQHLTGSKYYKDQDDVYSHFINWLKTQKIENNGGTAKKLDGKTKFNAGQHELLDSLEQDLSSRGVKINRA